jgi:opacity protein-like surface antigen
MKIKLLVIMVALNLVINSVYANYNPYISIIGGFSWAKIDKSQTLNFLDNLNNIYKSTAKYNSTPTIGIAGGFFVPVPIISPIKLQLGLGLYRTLNFKAKGDVYKISETSTPNTFYRYRLYSTRLMAEARFSRKIIVKKLPYQVFFPYINIGMGAAFNKAYNYYERAATDTDVPTPPFSNRTTTAFAAQIGAGINLQFKPHWLIGIGYQLAYLGKAKFGLSPAQNTSEVLKTKDIYTNSVLANLTYVI